MGKNWPSVALEEVLQIASRPESVEPTKEYHLLGVRLNNAGPFHRETKLGSELSAGTLYKVKASDFIYSRLFAWRAAFGIIDEKFDGFYVSNEFPIFLPRSDHIDAKFLNYWFHLPDILRKVEADCTGSTPLTRNRFKEKFFLNLEIPLPSLNEQRRIVARIEELATKVEQARELRRESVGEVKSLCRSIIFHTDGWNPQPTPMRELVSLREPDVEVKADEIYHFAGMYSFGRGVFSGQIRQGSEFAYKRLSRVKSGNFIYPKLMAWEGALGVVPPECDGLVVSPEFPVFEVNEDKVLPEVLDTYFKTSSVWPIVANLSIGTNVRRRRLQPSTFLSYKFPLPPMHVQLKLREIKQKLAPITEMQATTATQLEALLPSILDRAFRGEL